MKVFKFYDLKDGTERHIMYEQIEEDKHLVQDIVSYIIEVFCKVVFPVIFAFIIYLLIGDCLYEIRGYYGVGSEIFLPFLIWYAGYRFMESLF